MRMMDFPSEADVQQMAARQAPAVDLSHVADSLFVEEWEMEGSLPHTVGHDVIHPQTPWETDVLAAVADLPDSTSTVGMRCLAEQYVRFYDAHEAYPSLPIARFLAARCGWVGDVPSVTFIRFEGSRSLEDAWSSTRGQFLDNLRPQRRHRQPLDAAVWAGAVGGQNYISLARGQRDVTLERRSLVDGDGFELRGRVLSDRHDGVDALVTRGLYDMERCQADEGVRFPEFSFTCPADRADHMIWFEFALKIRGQQFYNTNYAGQVWTDAPDNTYRAAPWRRAWAEHLATQAVDEDLRPRPLFGDRPLQGDGLEERIVELTNIVREMAGRSPVRLNHAQSRMNSSLAPFLYNAFQEEDWPRIYDYTMAMMAGWEIEERLLSARLQARTVLDGDGRDAVDSFLELPSGREVLTRPEIHQVAFGTIQDRGFTWVSMTGYLQLPEQSADAMVTQAIATINAARADAGVGPLRDAENYQEASVLLSRGIQRGSHDPGEATSRVMRAMANNLRTSVRAYTILTDDLERIHMPDPVVLTPRLRAAILAAPYQGPNDPWALYQVIVIYPEGDMDL